MPSAKKSSSQTRGKVGDKLTPKGLGRSVPANNVPAYRRGAPPPPSEPAPPNQPLISSFRFNYEKLNRGNIVDTDQVNASDSLTNSAGTAVHG